MTAAQGWIQPLLELASNEIRTHVYGMEIAIRRKKKTMALKSLVKSSSLLDEKSWQRNKQGCRFIEGKAMALYITILFFSTCTLYYSM